jgi:tRNA pseudouridine13 synthase
VTLKLPTEWHYAHGLPVSQALFKQQSADFIVREKLGYEPCGEGEHLYVWLRKTDLNTAFVAEQLARHCKIPLRNVSYAGRKDKFAVSEQWFGIHLPGKRDIDWTGFSLDGTEILASKRHNKKLRTGQLIGNHFEIRLRNLSHPEAFTQRLALVQQAGVPNYFGEQRFGVRKSGDGQLQQGGNLDLAERMVQGESIRNRNKRSMAISALRSWLFNHVVSERIAAQTDHAILVGDALKLAGSNSFFVANTVDAELERRLIERDIELTAPMWGSGGLACVSAARKFELGCIEPYRAVANSLEQLGLKQERRALNVFPNNLSWQFDKNDVTLKFDLPAGCFATAVIRELTQTEQE